MSQSDQSTENTSPQQKKKGISFFAYGISVILFLVVGFIIGTRADEFFPGNFTSNISHNLNLSSVEQTYTQLREKYDGTLDTRKLVEGANKGLVEAAGDQYTAYFNAQEAEEFSKDLDGTFTGIGAELDKKEDKLIIVSPLEASPAEKAGLQANDVITKVNSQSTANWSIDEAVSKIKGQKGTTVKLTILRGEEVKDISITRDVIKDPSVKTEAKDGVGIIRISRFGDDTAGRVRKAADEFKTQNLKGIIVDLRGNGGGYLESAQEIASLWLDNGKVVLTERRGGEIIETHRAEGNPVLKGVPTVILIDQSSASASEILAGALQDNQVARLVGEKSFGKGSVQSIIDLSGGAKLKVTIAKWYTPKGKNISKHGITPDVTVAFSEGDSKNQDPQLNRALELLK